jgi:2'-5' RNA ligase
VWLGARAGLSQLCTLHDEVAGRLKESGDAVAARPFRPHVTIGSVKHLGHADASQIRAVLETIPLAVPTWLVGRVVPYEGRLSSRGSTYDVLTSGHSSRCPRESIATGPADSSRAY